MPDQACSERSRRASHDGAAPEAWARAVDRLACAETTIAALAHSDDQDAYDEAVDRPIAVLGRVLEAAAPDLQGVAAKIALPDRHQAWELRFGEAAFVGLEDDVRRLAAA
jgi:hypothetical protein